MLRDKSELDFLLVIYRNRQLILDDILHPYRMIPRLKSGALRRVGVVKFGAPPADGSVQSETGMSIIVAALGPVSDSMASAAGTCAIVVFRGVAPRSRSRVCVLRFVSQDEDEGLKVR